MRAKIPNLFPITLRNSVYSVSRFPATFSLPLGLLGSAGPSLPLISPKNPTDGGSADQTVVAGDERR